MRTRKDLFINKFIRFCKENMIPLEDVETLSATMSWADLILKADDILQRNSNEKYWLDEAQRYVPQYRFWFCTACKKEHRLKVISYLTYYYRKGVRYPYWLIITQHPSTICRNYREYRKQLKKKLMEGHTCVS